MRKFCNKSVWITGGSSGIGLELAKRLAEEGSNIAIFSRNEVLRKRALEEIMLKAPNPNQIISDFLMDVTSETSVLEAVAEASDRSGPPDILILSAGIAGAGRLEEMTNQDFDFVMKTNVSGTRYAIAAAIPFMKARGGRIVILSSLAGLVSMYGYSAYGASKYALVGMAEALRAELRRYKIYVSVVCPPEVMTPFLENEKGKLPAQGQIVKMMAGVLTVEEAGMQILDGIRKNRFFIVPGAKARFSWYAKRFLPASVMHLVTDLSARMAREKK